MFVKRWHKIHAIKDDFKRTNLKQDLCEMSGGKYESMDDQLQWEENNDTYNWSWYVLQIEVICKNCNKSTEFFPV